MKTKEITYTIKARVKSGLPDATVERAIERQPIEFFNLKGVKIKEITVEVTE
jgi:hypothetical protein